MTYNSIIEQLLRILADNSPPPSKDSASVAIVAGRGLAYIPFHAKASLSHNDNAANQQRQIFSAFVNLYLCASWEECVGMR
jgi:hypothetical protein